MAKSRNNWINRLTLGKEDAPDLTLDKLPSSRWQIFKDIFFQKMWILFRINFMVVLFALPAIAWLMFIAAQNADFLGKANFSGNLGLGHAADTGTDELANSVLMFRQMQSDLILIPLILLVSLGLSGAFRMMKLLIWKENTEVTKDFFRGIKENWKQFVVIGFFAGTGFFFTRLNINVYRHQSTTWYNMVGIICTIIALVFLAIMSMFMFTQGMTYNLSFKNLVKNSWIFSISLLPLNVFFVFLAFLPVIVLLIFPATISLITMLYFFLGFSYTILVFSLYTNYVFEKYAQKKLAVVMKDKAVYTKSAEKTRAIAQAKSKNKYSNPKKKKKVASIDEGKSITPLAPTFSRSDLARLSAEKEELEKEE